MKREWLWQHFHYGDMIKLVGTNMIVTKVATPDNSDAGWCVARKGEFILHRADKEEAMKEAQRLADEWDELVATYTPEQEEVIRTQGWAEAIRQGIMPWNPRKEGKL